MVGSWSVPDIRIVPSDHSRPSVFARADTTTTVSQATFELYEDEEGKYRWRLVHDNGNIIADSGEGYTDRRDAENGIESVKRNAPGAEVVETED